MLIVHCLKYQFTINVNKVMIYWVFFSFFCFCICRGSCAQILFVLIPHASHIWLYLSNLHFLVLFPFIPPVFHQPLFVEIILPSYCHCYSACSPCLLYSAVLRWFNLFCMRAEDFLLFLSCTVLSL